MPVAKIIELSCQSERSFEDAIQEGVRRATSSLRNVQGAWVKEQQVSIENGQIKGYRVNLVITFMLDGGADEGEDR